MNQALKAKMDDLAFRMTELAKELRLEPDSDSQFCARQIGTCLATMNMHIQNQWGMKLEPKEMPEPVTLLTIAESQAPATPKAKKETK